MDSGSLRSKRFSNISMSVCHEKFFVYIWNYIWLTLTLKWIYTGSMLTLQAQGVTLHVNQQGGHIDDPTLMLNTDSNSYVAYIQSAVRDLFPQNGYFPKNSGIFLGVIIFFSHWPPCRFTWGVTPLGLIALFKQSRDSSQGYFKKAFINPKGRV